MPKLEEFVGMKTVVVTARLRGSHRIRVSFQIEEFAEEQDIQEAIQALFGELMKKSTSFSWSVEG